MLNCPYAFIMNKEFEAMLTNVFQCCFHLFLLLYPSPIILKFRLLKGGPAMELLFQENILSLCMASCIKYKLINTLPF